MYDELVCERPLPGTPPAFIGPGHRFQTKDFDCELAVYTVRADGSLWREGRGDAEPAPHDFTGRVEFGTSNFAAGGHGATFTRGGEDWEDVDYAATFAGGRLVELVEDRRERGPALPVAELRAYRPPPAPDLGDHAARRAESLAGRTMYRACDSLPQWGGPVRVVADGVKQWCVRHADGRLELVHRFQRDVTLFDSEADAAAAREAAAYRRRHAEEHFARLLAGRAGKGAG